MNKTKVAAFLQDYGGIMALVVALTAMLGSLYFSEVAGFVPCTLCWYQRILMYPLTLITLVGVIKQDEYLPFYVWPLSVLGAGVSSYHTLIQSGVFSHPATCTVGVPCSLRYVNYLGFITIPLLALTAFVLITAVMILTHWAFANDPSAEGSEVEKSGIKWWAPLAAMILLLAALTTLAAFRGDDSAKSVPTGEGSPFSSDAPLSGEAMWQQQVFDAAPGCVACHSLEPDVTIVGPSLAGVSGRAGQRVSGQSAADYLRESIVSPDAYVVDGFTAGVMYQNYETALTEEQIEALISFLLSLP